MDATLGVAGVLIQSGGNCGYNALRHATQHGFDKLLRLLLTSNPSEVAP